MPFIPHTEEDIETMLKTIGISSLDALFSEIPPELMLKKLNGLPKAMNEMQIAQLMMKRAAQDEGDLCFLGAGAYEHHIPALVWDLASRAEFMTAYTPYQPEASQGGLQLLYEYQTMMASLTGMDASNASLYDGASALAEAILMAVRSHSKGIKRVLVPESVHPLYRETINTIVTKQGIELINIPFDSQTGQISQSALTKASEFSAFVIPQPNFFGVLENVDALTDWAHQKEALVIALVNPTSLAFLKEPGLWGKTGADIACGEGQPLGIPLASGGPYLGFLCCKAAWLRQMPGRIVGKTQDSEGNSGYILTLQAREQHIRRSKATSNICSNEGLMAVAATIYLSLLGPHGLKKVALACHHQTKKWYHAISRIKEVSVRFSGSYFHEMVITLPKSAKKVAEQMAECKILAGLPLGGYYSGMDRSLLVCCTETKTDEDIERYVRCLKSILAEKTGDTVSSSSRKKKIIQKTNSKTARKKR